MSDDKMSPAAEESEEKIEEHEGESTDDDEEEYEVEKIMKKRTNRKGAVEYFIKWKGYDHGQNTWEQEDDVHCTELIEEFLKTEKEKGSARKSRGAAGGQGAGRKRTRSDSDDDDEEEPPLKEPKGKGRGRPAATTKKEKETAVVKPMSMNDKFNPSFDSGDVALKVVGATKRNGQLMVLVKWRDYPTPTLVSNRDCRMHSPAKDLLLDFYEQRLVWEDEEDK